MDLVNDDKHEEFTSPTTPTFLMLEAYLTLAKTLAVLSTDERMLLQMKNRELEPLAAFFIIFYVS